VSIRERKEKRTKAKKKKPLREEASDMLLHQELSVYTREKRKKKIERRKTSYKRWRVVSYFFLTK
jgi:hypothetical protein